MEPHNPVTGPSPRADADESKQEEDWSINNNIKNNNTMLPITNPVATSVGVVDDDQALPLDAGMKFLDSSCLRTISEAERSGDDEYDVGDTSDDDDVATSLAGHSSGQHAMFRYSSIPVGVRASKAVSVTSSTRAVTRGDSGGADNDSYKERRRIQKQQQQQQQHQKESGGGSSGLDGGGSSPPTTVVAGGGAVSEQQWKQQQKEVQRQQQWSDIFTPKVIILFVAACLLAIGVLAAIIAVAIKNDDPPDNKNSTAGGNAISPTMNSSMPAADNSNLRKDAIVKMDEFLRQYVSENVINLFDQGPYLDDILGVNDNPQTSAYKARQWMQIYDVLLPEVVNAGFQRFKQRFGLVSLYYALNGTYWTNTTKAVLRYLVPDLHECNWTGVVCYEPNATERLRARLLRKTSQRRQYSSTTANTSKLSKNRRRKTDTNSTTTAGWNDERTVLSARVMSNTNPTLTSKTISLVENQNRRRDENSTVEERTVIGLRMSRTNVTGQLPSELSALQSLVELNFSGNMLSGTIPASIFELGLRDLLFLDLSNNKFTGVIPTIILSLTNLNQLVLNDNTFTGKVDRRFQRASPILERIWIQNNRLNESFPSWFPELDSLVDLRASNNLLTGTIPRPISRFLNHIDLSYNRLTGNIPDSLWSLITSPPNLTNVYLNNNQLSGPLPASDQKTFNLRKIWINDNKLTGAVPIDFAKNWYNLEELRLENNPGLSGYLGIPSPLTPDPSLCYWGNSTIVKVDSGVACFCCTIFSDR